MLQVVISPAKQMRAAQDAFEVLGIPPFARETARLHRALLDIERNEGSDSLQALWNVSDKLLGPCLNTLHEFGPILKNGDLENPALACHLSPAVMSYHGIQYQSMAPEVMDSAQLAWLQSHLWILSGLYGCVRPFHAVEPYRLEMGAKLAVDDAPDLYAGYRPGKLKPHDRQPRQRRVRQSRSAPSRGRRHGRHVPLWRRHPQRQAHPALDRQQKGTWFHGALDGRKQARGCKRAHRV